MSGNPSTYTISYASRDSAGNPLSVQDWNGTTAYTYDNNSRLVQTGGYDWVGNRDPDNWTYNDADQLTARPGYLYEYDYRGNVTFQSDDSFNTQKYYEYTPTNLVSSVQHLNVQGEPESTMTWDADGNRISFTDSDDSETTEFVYDTTAGIPAVIEEVTPSGPVYYIREPNGALIARVDGETTHYYHFDALGSTRLLTGASGTVTDQYAYDAWGNVTAQSGSTAQPYRYVGELGYYTHYQDANLSLLQLGVRFYDPGIGRFTQRDPLRGRFGHYSYSGLRPTIAIDPSGLAYMSYSSNLLCLYHDDGSVWMCCEAVSGVPGSKTIPQIAPGTYEVDPKNICCYRDRGSRFPCSLFGGDWGHPRWRDNFCAWGHWRTHLECTDICQGYEQLPHSECFIHGGDAGRAGTLGCIRVPDPPKGKGDYRSDCLSRLMNILKGLGAPVGLYVAPLDPGDYRGCDF